MQPNTNLILVRPDHKQGDAGIVVAEFAETHRLLSIVGTVEAVCQGLWYGGYELLRLGKNPAGKAMDRAQEIMQRSLLFDVPLEVVVGDRVVFPYMVHVSEDTLWYDGAALVRYDQLVARIDGPALYPLNGAVLVERYDAHENGPLLTPLAILPGEGKVVYEGALVKNYLFQPDRGGDFDIPLVGRTILFRSKDAVRIEHDAHRVLDQERRYPLYHLHRYAINAWYDGKT